MSSLLVCIYVCVGGGERESERVSLNSYIMKRHLFRVVVSLVYFPNPLDLVNFLDFRHL
jgi:hypothetical protein